MTETIFAFLDRGGPVLWLIALISVLTLALILWKILQLARLGAWSGTASKEAIAAWSAGETAKAHALVAQRKSIRARLVTHAMDILRDDRFRPEDAREEITRYAKAALSELRIGLRALELVMTIAPLLGLLGTVLGMIEAFQTLQDSGAQANPADLAGGIWEALLTTAAGMAVAIPAGIALSWFEGLSERIQGEMEDAATRLFTRRPEAS